MYGLSCVSSFHFHSSSSSRSSDDADAVYVLDLQHLPAGLAAVCSDQQLSVFNPEDIARGPIVSHKTQHGNVRAMSILDWTASLIATAGDDGRVQVWDMRVPGGTANGGFTATQGGNAILSIASDSASHTIAVGTDLQNQASYISLWDVRTCPTQQRVYQEVHSDDVTVLNFDPTNPAMLISGSTDGLVNVCDTRLTNEDEVVVETFNHGASVHRAGRLGPASAIFALSHDERFAVYSTDEGSESGLAAADFGDLREGLDCRYAANVTAKLDGSGAILGVGNQDRESFKLVLMSRSGDTWAMDQGNTVSLVGAHGSDLVRSFCFIDEAQVVFSAGEDANVKAWRAGG